jgi:hypothetical protein
MEYQEGAGASGGEKEDAGEEQTVKVRRETATPVNEYLGIDQLPFKMACEVMNGRLGYTISDDLIRKATEYAGQYVRRHLSRHHPNTGLISSGGKHLQLCEVSILL